MKQETHKLSALDLDEVSTVDRGGNQHADIILFKRDYMGKCSMGGDIKKCSMMKSGKCSKDGCSAYMEEEMEKAASGVKFNVGFPKDGGGSDIQSVVFDSEQWTEESAKAWLKAHDMASGKMDKTENTLRFRQKDPEGYARFRMITPGKQVSKGLRANESFNQLQTKVTDALRQQFQTSNPTPTDYLWIRDLYKDYVVFDQNGATYQAEYALSRDPMTKELRITVGERELVEVVYQVVKNDPPKKPIAPETLMRLGKLQAGVSLLTNR